MRKFLPAALGLINRRQTAYMRTYSTPDGQYVLKDQMRFSRFWLPTFDPDVRIDARYAGRKDQIFRILDQLNLTQQQLALKYQAAQFEDEDNG